MYEPRFRAMHYAYVCMEHVFTCIHTNELKTNMNSSSNSIGSEDIFHTNFSVNLAKRHHYPLMVVVWTHLVALQNIF